MAKLDLIDRTALVEELEGLKTILGDVFLGMVVERAIERVKAQPVVGAVPVAAPRACYTCKHSDVHQLFEPCASCIYELGPCFPNWEAPDEEV